MKRPMDANAKNEICSNCHNPNTYWMPVDGFQTCSSCGMVGGRIFDESLERRNFSDSAVDHNRGSVLDQYLQYSVSNIVGTNTKRSKRLQYNHNRLTPASMSQRETNLAKWFKQVNSYTNLFELGRRVRDDARAMLNEFSKNLKRKIRGTGSGALAIAALFLSCSKLEDGTQLMELALSASQGKSSRGVARLFSSILFFLGEKDRTKFERDIRKFIKMLKLGKEKRIVTGPTQFISTYRTDMDLPYAVERLCRLMLVGAMEYKDVHMEGKSSCTLAAACIKVACGMLNIECSLDSIAASAQIADATLRKVSTELEKHKDFIVSNLEVLKIKRDLANGIGA